MSDPVNGTQQTNGAVVYNTASTSGSTVANQTTETTLPTPSPAATGITGDDMVILHQLLNKMSDASIATGQAQIEASTKLQQKAISDEAAARQQEEKNRSTNGGFFHGLKTAAEALTVDLVKLKTVSHPFEAVEGSLNKAGDATIKSRQFWVDTEKGALEVAKWGAVAGSTALAVGSFGAATPIAALAVVGAVMSTAAAADSEFGILQKCGVSKNTAMWMDVGLCVGGALSSGGAGIAQMISTPAANVALAVRVGGIIADGTSAAATVGGGVAHIEVAKFERDAKLAEADATDAENRQQHVEQRIQNTYDALRETVESSTRGTKRISDGMNIQTATSLAMVRV